MSEPLRFPGGGRLPSSPETERAVLGAVLLEPRYLVEYPIWADLFHERRHALVLAAIAELHEQGRTIDMRTVQAQLEADGELEAVGGVAYLAGLDAELPDLSGIASYVAILEQLRLRRRLVEIGARVSSRASKGEGDPEEQIAAAQREILEAMTGHAAARGAQSMAAVAAELAEEYTQLEPGTVRGIPTGLSDLDAVLGGFEEGRLYVLAGRPGMGKSSLAQQVAEHQKGLGRHGLVVSLEMTVPEYATRSLVRRSGVPYDQMRTGHMSDRQRAAVLAAVREIRESADLAINDQPGLTLGRIAYEARAAKARNELHVLWVDHIGLMMSDERHDSRNEEVGAFSRGLKNLAKELDVAVVALSQLNRQCEARRDKRPLLSDLRDSGAIEQDADTVIFIYRDEVYYPDSQDQGIAEMNIAKHRDGRIGRVRVVWVGERMEFLPLAREAGR